MNDIAFYLPGLFAAWSIQLVSCLTPGPVVAVILGSAATGDRAGALRAAAGTATAAGILALLVSLGLASAATALSEGIWALRLAGAAYLAWLAFNAFRRATSKTPPLRAGGAGGYRTALAVSLSSPKALAFWLAIAALGGIVHAPWPVVALFVAGSVTLSAAVHSGWAIFLSSTVMRAAYGRARRWIEGTLGLFFAFFAFRLATDRS
ncbi:LysE family translocator [Jannaschia donghaensis]|uniref:Threonine efflux protein n=1 Tax=Jannaschia donghaensis TaxID=420998 RepID=A0A0M6YH08_9RHOB|nr:LysE family transporter [Jannaschia donghaensis]CTQ48975.1 Threonine efflux protein [Jannaschia donghaensis]